MQPLSRALKPGTQWIRQESAPGTPLYREVTPESVIGTSGLPDWSRPKIKWTTDLRRFGTSVHCRDLFVIAILALVFLVFVIWVIYKESISNGELVAALLLSGFAAVAWAFQSANLRFGAADIFASEILTLCRIARVVDFIPHLIDEYNKPGARPLRGRPTQDYFVIFHNNSKDLEILDGNSVNWVTEFYVYFKAMQDTLSNVATPDHGADSSTDRCEQYKAWLANVIYMAFLAFESGRHALMQLIDDKDLRRQAVLAALSNELPAYLHLRQALASSPNEDDIRAKRIRGRDEGYRCLMKQIGDLAEDQSRTDLAGIRIRDLAKEITAKWAEAESINAGGRSDPR